MSDCTKIQVEDHSGEYWVTKYFNVYGMGDPTPLAPNELDLGLDASGKPIRKPIDWLPAYTGADGAIYSKFVNKVETEMTQAEKDVIDAAIAAKKEAEKEEESDILKWNAVQRAFAEVLVNEINILRSQHSLPNRTVALLSQAIKSKL